MGAKAGILAIGDGNFAALLQRLPTADAVRTTELIAELYPGYHAEPVQGGQLAESTYPDDDIVYALSAPGIDILCDGRFVTDKLSELPEHVLRLAAGRQVVLLAMHSVDDSFAYAVWNDGELARSLSLSLPRMIIEDIGDPAEFEQPFWAARKAYLERHPGALGFHPLDLAQQAMRHLFGFALEGVPEPGDTDPEQISMLGYKVTDPSGVEQAAREAAQQEFLKTHHLRKFRMAPGGSLVEIMPEKER